MTGPSLGPLTRCPFRHCLADLMLVIEQATPGDDESTVKRIPQHRIVGEAERFGQCPASLMIIPLDAYCRETLATIAEEIGRMIAPPADPPPPRESAPRGGIFPVTGRDWFRPGPGQGTQAGHGGVNVPQHGKAGQSVTPLEEGPHAGPGPGRASKPFQPTGADVVEQVVPPKLTIVPPTQDDQPQQGSTAGMSDNDLRAQLIALTTLAIEGFGQQQEMCSQLTEQLERMGDVTFALMEKQQATHSIALAAVGSRSDVPEAAANMIGASASIDTTIEEVRATRALLTGFVAATHAYAASAASNARAYLAQI